MSYLCASSERTPVRSLGRRDLLAEKSRRLPRNRSARLDQRPARRRRSETPTRRVTVRLPQTETGTGMLQRYLLVWLTLLSLVAFAWPQLLGPAWDPFIWTRPFNPHLFAVTMFAIGALLPEDEIRQVARRWPTVLGGTATQYLSMPLLAYVCGHAFGLSGEVLLGVILVGCVPGAMASNVLTLTARGNVSYSVSLTTLATLLSPLVVPLALYLTTHQSGVDRVLLARKSFWILLTQVVGPVLLGHALARLWKPFQRTMQAVGPVVANLAILWIIAVVVNANHANFGRAGVALLSVLLLVNALGYAAGYGSSTLLRLPEGMKKALTLEVGMQNAGLGATLAQQLFPGQPLVELPPALYTFGCMLTGTVLAQLWARRSSWPEAAGSAEAAAGDEPSGPLAGEQGPAGEA